MKKSLRPYISTGITFAFIIMVISGIALYFAPSCRVARMTGWHFLFISKESWETFHIIFAVFFLVLGILHTYINWDTLVSYLNTRSDKIFNRPLVITAAVTLLFLILSVLKVPPVSWLTDLNDQFKRGQSTRQYQERDYRGRGKDNGRGRYYRDRQDYPGAGEENNR